ncbi:MAG: ABC transporter ATP-binding protein [Clostridia bacterium]|nr:ABC transporter ATP-binding protein [Clostridia bacterium]MBR5947461.1 ABC transporter ATP-binding protein [Clostridia bacterium]
MVKLDSVSFSYDKPSSDNAPRAVREVLKNLSLEISEGETIAVMGASGSGKTTLIKLLLGLIKPDSGTVDGMGTKRVSAVFQEDRLLPWYSAKENVALVFSGRTKSERERAALELLAELELDAADKPIRELSGGMRRRVAIARALAYGGDLLLLDEPLKGLDAELKARVAQSIKRRFSTILLITHDEDEVKLFDCRRVYRI